MYEEVLSKVDAVRREKSLKLGQPRAKAASLGAGLLLQWAVKNWQSAVARETAREMCSAEDTDEPTIGITELSIEEILAQIKKPFPLSYRYGGNGKPYLQNFPLCFSISHSGDYVLCAVSEEEIGADLQWMRFSRENYNMSEHIQKLSRRFFAESEYKALEECKTETERTELFFELWAKKEAMGKLTGQGVTEMLSEPVKESIWLKIVPPQGYAAAVCVENLGEEIKDLQE